SRGLPSRWRSGLESACSRPSSPRSNSCRLSPGCGRHDGWRSTACRRRRPPEAAMNIVGRRNWYFLLSLAIILPGILSMAFFGFRLGIDFAGGDQFNIEFKQPTQAAVIQREMDTFNVEATVQQAGRNNFLITTKHLGT